MKKNSEEKQKMDSKGSSKESKQDSLKKELESYKQRLSEMEETYRRLQAEFANYKRRTEEEKANAVNIGVSKALKYFINVFDDFDLALKNKTENVEEYRKGMELLFAKLVSTGEELGLQKIKTVGEQFNPLLHEALLAEESEKPEQEILEELQSGYLFKERPLRTAKVKVAKK